VLDVATAVLYECAHKQWRRNCFHETGPYLWSYYVNSDHLGDIVLPLYVQIFYRCNFIIGQSSLYFPARQKCIFIERQKWFGIIAGNIPCQRLERIQYYHYFCLLKHNCQNNSCKHWTLYPVINYWTLKKYIVAFLFKSRSPAAWIHNTRLLVLSADLGDCSKRAYMLYYIRFPCLALFSLHSQHA
jgi:hypothetical protein